MTSSKPRFITSPAAIPEGIQLALVGARDYRAAVKTLATGAHIRNANCIYLTSNRPASFLRSEFDAVGLSAEATTIVDTVTALIGIMPAREPGIWYLESPTLLEQAGIRAQQVVRRKPEPRLVIVDSLTTFATYTSEATVAAWMQSFVDRLRKDNAEAIFVSMQSQTSPEFLAQIAPMCDGVFRL